MDMTFVDLDDTLFEVVAKIGVVSGGTLVRTLSTQEFPTYKLAEGEEFDFSEFSSAKVFERSVPLVANIRAALNDFSEEVAILTARSDIDDPGLFLKTLERNGIPVGHYKDGKVHVIRCAQPGLSAQESKVRMLRRILKKRPDVTAITVIDDCVENLQAIVASNLPVKIHTVLAHAKGLSTHTDCFRGAPGDTNEN